MRARRFGDLLPVLMTLGMVALAMSWTLPAWSAEKEPDAEAAARQVADTEAAVGEMIPIFGLPPIVVQVRNRDDAEGRTIAFKADLIFDEDDPDRIEDSVSVTKHLLPRIMDSVITGLDGKRVDNMSNPESVTRTVVERANLVLKPYGVVVKALKIHFLGWR
jgi:hypothetical protein